MNFLIKRGRGFSLPPGCYQGLGLSCPVFIGLLQNKQQAKVDIGICFVLACLITKAVVIKSIDLPTEGWILRSILKLQQSPEVHIAEMKEKLDVHWIASFLVQLQRLFGFCFVWREASCQGGISMTVLKITSDWSHPESKSSQLFCVNSIAASYTMPKTLSISWLALFYLSFSPFKPLYPLYVSIFM